MELPFAGVHQFCAAMPDRFDALPAPQRDALEVALGLVAGEVPDRFLVGLAVLSLMSAVAEERPLLCLVEDAQWLDAASAQVLGLVARRVRAESVAIVVAVREPTAEHDFDGSAELRLEGLPEQDARSAAGERRHRPARQPRRRPDRRRDAREPACPAGASGAHDRRRAGRWVRASCRRRASDAHRGPLPPARPRAARGDAATLMLVAAAEPSGDPALVLRAGRQLGHRRQRARACRGCGAVGDRERASSSAIPLVRSAVYRAAPLVSRQRVHEALAAVSDPDDDADRRAWHRALAAAGTGRGRRRRARAVGRSSAGSRRGRRNGGFPAARRRAHPGPGAAPCTCARGRCTPAIQAGAFTTARGLLATAEAGPLDELQRAQIDLLRAQLAFVSSRGTDAIPLLLAAARRLEPLDISVARETYVDAFSAALFGGRLNGSVGVREVAEAARAAPRPPGAEPRNRGPAAGRAGRPRRRLPERPSRCCRKAVQRLSGEKASAKDRLRWLWQGCVVALEIWDDEHAFSLSGSSVEIARATGTLSELALALSARAPILVFCGDLAAPQRTVSETASVEEATGIRSAPYGALMVSAWRGRPRRNGRSHRDDGARGERSRRGDRTGHQRLRARRPVQRPRPVRGRARRRRIRQRAPRGRRGELGPERAGRAGHALRQVRSRHGRAEPAGHQGTGHAHRLGARHRGARSGAARRRR